MKNTLFMQTGFTLLETSIYIALLSLVIGSAVSCAFMLARTSTHASADSIASNEALFSMAKIRWALSATSSSVRIISPTPGAYSNELSLINTDGRQIDFYLAHNRIYIRNTHDTPLTSAQVRATSLSFYRDAFDMITASTTINDLIFSTTHAQ